MTNGLEQLKGIKHLNKVSYEEFKQWMYDLSYYSLTGDGLEISEKIDGNIQVSFGILNDKFYISPKANEIYYSEDECKYEIQKKAFKVLSRFEKKIRDNFIILYEKDVVQEKHGLQMFDASGDILFPQFFAEILYTPIPNVTEYGKNMIIFYKASLLNKITYDLESSLIDMLLKLLPKTTMMNGETWHFYKKPILDYKLFEVVEYYTQLLNYTDEEDVNKNIQNAICNNIRERVVEQLSPKYGKKRGIIEGVVIKNKKTGQIVKVTSDKFKSESDRLWKYRQLLGKGYTPYDSDTFLPGIEFEFYKQIANITSIKSLWNKYFGLRHVLKNIKVNKVNYKSLNTALDAALLRYIYENKLFQGIKDKDKACEVVIALIGDVFNKINKLNEEWDKESELFDDYNIERTDNELINRTEQFIDLYINLEKISKSKLSDDFKLVYILKIVLGKKELMRKL